MLKSALKGIVNWLIKRQRTFITRVITDNIAMWVITAQHCRLGLFQDSDFAGDLEDSKSTSDGILCIFGSRTFVPVQ